MNPPSSLPQGVIKKVSGRCIVLSGDDIDTDRIIPARFLKCVSFKDLGEHVFADDRIELKGAHPFDSSINKGASILVVNENFGCGSSREHAPQALIRWGIRAMIGQSFSEIFFGNCLALGIPCATASAKDINKLQKAINYDPKESWDLIISSQSIKSHSQSFQLIIESGPLEMLKTGQWDATSQLISQSDSINNTIKKIPYLNNFNN